MDKLKNVWDVVKKYHFWMLLGVILVFGVLLYVTAVAGLKGEYDTREKAIVDKWQQTTRITTEPEHPNEDSIKGKEESKRKQEELNNLAWRELYRKQKKDNRWPGVLGQEFLSAIRQLKPDQQIGRNHREIYRDHIKAALPRLFEIVDYRRQVPLEPGEIAAPTQGAEAAMMGPMGPMGPMGLGGTENYKTIGIVQWNEADRLKIENDFLWTDIPSSLRVRFAQEDYWVYKALLNIIRETNGKAQTQSSAAIKRIEALEIGRRAAESIATRTGPTLVAGADPAAGAAGPAGPEGPMGAMGAMSPGGYGAEGMVPMGPAGAEMGPAGGATSAADSDESLWDRRYVKDEKLTPLTGEEAKNQGQFRRMPVRMELVIDQRNIPDLLVQCANAAMPVEVVQLQINPSQAMAAPGMGGVPGMGGPMGGPMGSPMGGPMGGPMGAPMGGLGLESMGGLGGGAAMGNQFESLEKTGYEVTIDLRGIIYIYLPSPLEEGQEEVERAEEITEITPIAPAAPAAPATPVAPPAAPATPAAPAAPPTAPAAPPAAGVPATPADLEPTPLTP